MGNVYHKMAHATEGNTFGAWDPETLDVEDSAFGYITMENGASIWLETSWILNLTKIDEGAISLAGTDGGAEILNARGQSGELLINNAKHGYLNTETPSFGMGGVAFFEGGGSGTPQLIEAEQWLRAIWEETAPLVKPEQAFVVTQILEGVYKSFESGTVYNF